MKLITIQHNFHHETKRVEWQSVREVMLPKLTVMLKYFVLSTMCLESARDPVKKLRTEPAPLACQRNGILGLGGQWLQ